MSSAEQAAAAAMVADARARGLELTDPDGLLTLVTKNVLETALGEEMTEHLGHEKNRAEPTCRGHHYPERVTELTDIARELHHSLLALTDRAERHRATISASRHAYHAAHAPGAG